MRDLQRLAQQTVGSEVSTIGYTPVPQHVPAPEKWTHSTVTKWHVRYSPPVSDLSLDYSVEALVEGSDMSLVHDDGSMTPDLAWKYREGRQKRYEGKRVGGTVVVHFIKKNMWFLETAAAFLHGEDVTVLERAVGQTRSEPGAELGDSPEDGGVAEEDGVEDEVALFPDPAPASSSASLPIATHSVDSSTPTKARTNLQRSRRREEVH